MPAKKVTQDSGHTEVENVISGRSSAFEKKRGEHNLEGIPNDCQEEGGAHAVPQRS